MGQLSNFRPLYKCASELVSSQLQDANSGLLFDKFPKGWKLNRDKCEFEKSSWIQECVQRGCGQAHLVSEACRRQAEMAAKLGGFTLWLRNTSRFMTGLGRSHPLENGFAWHTTLGCPYLAGSGVKGVVRAWDREEGAAKDQLAERYGSPESGIGAWCFLDLLPCERPKLVQEIMTPHYGPYYSEGQIPGDWHSPVPIPFLAVEKNCSWQLSVVPRRKGSNASDAAKLRELLVNALEWNGAGAKTAVGYGRFEVDSDTERRELKKAQARKEAQAAEQARATVLETMDDDVRELALLSENEGWFAASGNTAMVQGLDTYLTNKETLSKSASEWLRDKVFESTNKGMWEDPDASKWQKKPKKKVWADRVKRVKSMTQDT